MLTFSCRSMMPRMAALGRATTAGETRPALARPSSTTRNVISTTSDQNAGATTTRCHTGGDGKRWLVVSGIGKPIEAGAARRIDQHVDKVGPACRDRGQATFKRSMQVSRLFDRTPGLDTEVPRQPCNVDRGIVDL